MSALAESALWLADFIFSPVLPALALSAFAWEYGALTVVSGAVPVHLHSHVVALKCLLGITLVRALNHTFNSWATSNWHAFTKPKSQWQDEVAIVTGGCSGIGKAIATALAGKGVKVAVLDLQEPPQGYGEELVDGLIFFKCDITSAADVGRAAQSIRSSLGHPSIVVNNAGIAKDRSILQTSDAELRKLFEVNVFAHWTMAKTFLPDMIKRNKGHIVTIASMSSFVSLANTADYSASKAGLLAFHECLASEIKHVFKAPGVMTTVVHPSYTRTALNESVADEIEKKHGKMLTPAYVAGRVVNQIMSGRGAQLIIPGYFSWVSAIKGFPNWIQECIRDQLSRP